MSIRSVQKIIGWLVLVFIVAALFSALTVSFSLQSHEGLVYCPLQKKWVAQNKTPIVPVPGSSPLGEICGSAKKKAEFTDQLLGSLNSAFRNFAATDIIDLYFAYSKEGKAAFSRRGSFPNSPELPGNVVTALDSAISSTQRNESYTSAPAVVGFDGYKEILVAAESPYFERAKFRVLTSVPRSLQPRAPPLS